MTGNRILYLLPQPYLLNRGSSFRARATLDALTELGYQIDLLCYPMGSGPTDAKYVIHRCARWPFLKSVKIGPSPAKLLQDILLLASACRLAIKNRYVLVHGVEEAGFIACLVGRMMKIPYIYDMHSWMSQQIEGTRFGRFRRLLEGFRRLELFAMKRARAIVTVGPEMSRLLQSLAPGVYTATLLDCPLPEEPGGVPPDEAEAIKSRYFSPSRKTILYTGNFHPYQGMELLLQSVKELKSLAVGRFEFVLLLVGGSEAEAAAVKTYRDMAANLGIEKEVMFCGEHDARLISVFTENADLLVSSRVTGNNVPLKIYSYLVSGKLLVATRIASHVQVLNEENCLLCDPDPSALAHALCFGLADITPAQKAAILAKAGTPTAEERRRTFKDILGKCYAYCLGAADQSQPSSLYHLAVSMMPVLWL